MTQVVSFEDFRPAARYDGLPWTEVDVEESVSATGPWAVIDTLTISPVDTDPENPALRSFTTELASDGSLWYRLVFKDASGDSFAPTHPLLNTPDPVAPATGPCCDWVSAEDVAGECDAIDHSGDPSVYDNYATMASQMLYAASGRQFSGVCGPVTARPCVPQCGCWSPGLDFAWNGWGSYWIGGGGNGVSAVQDCGGGCCGSLSRVKLSGYPVVEIVEVNIGGDVVPAEDYRLDGWKWLTYLDDTDGNHRRWPACQALARDAGESGTFAVSYMHGVAPPLLGQEAAVQLACALAAAGAECALPPGATQVDRQGVRIQLALQLATRPGELPPAFAWLPLVKAFLATVNPHGLTRRSAIHSFDGPQYAPRFGS